jgi:hypothetical protein
MSSFLREECMYRLSLVVLRIQIEFVFNEEFD